MIDLNSILTFSEAAEKWGFCDGNTLRKAVERKRFQEDEIRKSGNVWLTTYDAMLRVFGQPENIEYTIMYTDIIEIATRCLSEKKKFMEEIHTIYEKAQQDLRVGKSVAVVKSKEHIHLIVRIITTKEELDTWLQYYGHCISKK